MNVDTGGGNFGGRNTNIGLSGPWGTVFYGQWDTPYKFVTLRQDVWYATGIASNNLIIGNPGFGVSTATQAAPGALGTAANASFDRRQGDSVQYWSPSWNGLSFRAQYSANEAKSNESVTPELDPFTWGGAVIYENGPLYVQAAYERHEDYFGLNSLTANTGAVGTLTESEDQGIKLGVGYTFGNTTVHFTYENLDYENTQSAAGAVTDYDRDAFYVGLLHKIGAWTIRASYGHADEGDCDANGISCNSDEVGTDFYTAGASYSFSKRTDVYALFVLVDADDLSAFNFANGAHLGGPPTGGGTAGNPAGNTVGAQARGIGLGIRHSF